MGVMSGHPDQLSLAIPLWEGAIEYQPNGTGWGVKADMVYFTLLNGSQTLEP